MPFNDWFTKDDIKNPKLRNFRDTVIKTDPKYLEEYHTNPDPESKTRFLQNAIKDKTNYFVGTTTRDKLYEKPANYDVGTTTRDRLYEKPSSYGGRRKRTRGKNTRRKSTRRKSTRRKRPRRKNCKKSRKY